MNERRMSRVAYVETAPSIGEYECKALPSARNCREKSV